MGIRSIQKQSVDGDWREVEMLVDSIKDTLSEIPYVVLDRDDDDDDGIHDPGVFFTNPRHAVFPPYQRLSSVSLRLK